MRTPPRSRVNLRRTVRGAALTALLLFFACGEDGDHYAPLGNDSTPRATVVAGLVRDAGRNAVTDALVVIEPATDGVPASAGFLSRNPDAPSTSTPGRRVTTTNARGRFAFDNVGAGDYFLQVIADDHLGAMHSIKVPDPMAFVDTVYVDVNLTPTGTFSGAATLENAASHQGTVVYVEGTSYVAVTDPTGDYAITNVPVGSYTVRAEHPNYLEDTENGTITTAGEDVPLAGMLLKLDSNIPPVATITGATPKYEDAPVNFVASGGDADGTVVLYEWDWEDDGTFDYSSASTANTDHVYSDLGTYRAKLRVTDDDGAIGLAVLDLSIIEARVYMALGGSDTNDGSPLQPVATIAKAYQIAQLYGITEIYIQAGIYSQVPNFQPGIRVFGGRVLPSWNEGAGESQFNFSGTRATANNISSATTIRRVALDLGAAGANSNAIALYSLGSTSALVFELCRFNTASGLSGTGGGNGGTGANGGSGSAGFPGSCDGLHGQGGNGGTSVAGCVGGGGGDGGPEGPNDGQDGGVGACSGGAGGPGGLGSAGGPFSCNAVGQPGANGAGGLDGGTGGAGSSASNAGMIAANEWVPNVSGTGGNGVSGRGGGGGGGGGGQGGALCDDGGGNGGGGGGGGAPGGGGGSGGQGGRASFCVMLVNSSPTFNQCVFERGTGGTGGAGGAGGNGGLGGAGGVGALACTGEIGRGGNGGFGGDGGHGGGGGGGPGGPSYGIYRAGVSTPVTNGNTFIGGSGGSGGTGGFPNGLNGSNGLFGTMN